MTENVQVTEARSSKEALWQFEQTLHKPDAGFSVLFMDLAVASADDYAAVCEIRQAEHKDFGTSRFTPQVLIVAVTNHDRCESSLKPQYIKMACSD
jgi:CheY-like chemotaxis protein